MNDQDLTDLFAGMAMQGLLAKGHDPSQRVVNFAYDMAELMVQERALRQQGPENSGIASVTKAAGLAGISPRTTSRGSRTKKKNVE
jgi:hypothetical protein